MDLKYEFKKELKLHLYYNVYQNPPGVLSLSNDLTFQKDITLQKDSTFIKDLAITD